MGTIWPFEMRDLLTETQAVETFLSSLLSGIILLVSIVVSINAIVLSHDLTGIGEQVDQTAQGVETWWNENTPDVGNPFNPPWWWYAAGALVVFVLLSDYAELASSSLDRA